jgi:hypothetical protein
MSNKKSVVSVVSIESQTGFWQSLGKTERIFTIGTALLLTVGIFGAVSSNLNLFGGSLKSQVQSPMSENPNSTTQNAASSQPISTTNPPPTSAAPQLSKEYVYAGSRMLAVEDANANAAPPADLAVWRGLTGVWYVMGGTNSAQTFFQWGASSDKPAPGDYDGDGKTDFSIFRPSGGEWWIVKSSDSTTYAMQFGVGCPPAGTNCDQIAQADFDGDGKTDAAVFRPTNGTWYILPSSGGSYYGVPYGLSTDIPAPADYDGDGKADIGVWRGSTATFYSLNSSNGATSIAQIGQADSEAVSGDYDGDGRADYAIRSGNNWVIKRSSDGILDSVAWQDGADKAVQNDYDGDGKVDIATWNIGSGVWTIRQSANPLPPRIVQWGMVGDIPVPAYYRR